MSHPALTHYIVLWTRPGWRIAFQGDVYELTPKRARKRFRELFPGDRVCGVKFYSGNGRWIG